jgi:hypothetical protein
VYARVACRRPFWGRRLCRGSCRRVSHRPLCVRRAAFPPPCSLTPPPPHSLPRPSPPCPRLPVTPLQRIGSISLAYIPPISRPLSPLYPVLLSIPPSAHKCVRPFRSTPHQVGSVPPHCRGCLPTPLVSASRLLFPLPPFFVPPPCPPFFPLLLLCSSLAPHTSPPAPIAFLSKPICRRAPRRFPPRCSPFVYLDRYHKTRPSSMYRLIPARDFPLLQMPLYTHP